MGKETDENPVSALLFAVGMAATISVMWDASTGVDSSHWLSGATSAALAAHQDRGLASRAADVACLVVAALRSFGGTTLDRDGWYTRLADALYNIVPVETRAGNTKAVTRVVGKVVTWWYECKMASSGLVANHGVSLNFPPPKRSCLEEDI
ncbi:unnamed protein product [Closterium sp. NIES-54]